MTPRRRAACSACQGNREPTWRRAGDAACSAASISKMSPSKARSPMTKARARPSSPGDHSSRRTASGERTWSVSPVVGPREVPSQNSNRTGGGPPKKWASSGATAVATPPPGSGSAAAGRSCLGRNGRGLEMRSDRMSVSR